VAKKDLEETVTSIEFDSDDKWGGALELGDGSKYYLEPITRPRLPITLRIKRLSD
jgi:nitrogen fixation protein NifT